jgi:ligand-binding sensor domain-containing protein/signal transduction histidine kinase
MGDRSPAGSLDSRLTQAQLGGAPSLKRLECRTFWRSLPMIGLWLAFSHTSSADTPRPKGPTVVDHFIHTAWTAEQGAPQAAHAIAQTKDGYLWFAGREGLIRFDGVHFESYGSAHSPALPFSDISALMASPDGGLWIGYRTGGASLLKSGKITNYSEKDGLPSAQIFYFAMDADQVIWASTSSGLRRLEGSRWSPIGPEWGLSMTYGYHLFGDNAGGLWAVSQEVVYRLPPRSHRFVEASRTAHGGFLLHTADGKIWSEPGGPGVLADRIEIPQGQPPEPAWALQEVQSRGCHAVGPICAPSDGSSWVLSDQGVGWLPSAELLARKEMDPVVRDIPQFTEKEGLTNNDAIAILEDHEGNIWISTKSGVDRFRRRNVYSAPSGSELPKADLSLVADQDGGVWAGAVDQPLMKIQNDVVSKFGMPRKVVAMFRGHDGTIWIGGFGTLTRFVKDRFEEVKVPEELALAPNKYWKLRSIAEDKAGALWVSVVQNGVFRLQNGSWEQYGNVPGLPRLTAFIVSGGSDGRVWFGYTDNRIAALDGEKVSTFSSADGLAVGTVTAIGGQRGHVWVGGQFGLARLVGSRFVMVNDISDNAFNGISGIVETDDGDLWLNETNGIAHIAAAELQTKVHDVRHPLKYELFDSRDGVRGTATQLNLLPSAILSADGRIWVSGTKGASWIDPAHLFRNTVPPPVSIESLVVDGNTYSVASPIELPPTPSNLQIDYTALSLSIPERVNFRYQLEGIDKEWQDVGTRRSAFYTKLKPNAYRFKVIACNNDGIWNEYGAEFRFVVLPAFYQTWWFRLIYVALVICALWLFYLYRLNLATTQIQRRLGAQLEERERIARELHDTLLQGFHGLMLRFQAIMKVLPADGPAREMMTKVLDKADEVLLEGRESVRDLRESETSAGDLSAILAAAGEELAQNSTIAFNLTVVGESRAINPIVFKETNKIATEALSNAFQHSQAKKIEAELTYNNAGLSIRVRDDGSGIDSEILSRGKTGHWGLSGMRERAQKLGAQLNIWSKVGAGTEIELTIPPTVAYPQGRRDSIRQRIKRAMSGIEEI